jgi:hypothetical protein
VYYKTNVTLNPGNILSYGVNQMGDSNSIHAEQDAIRKLKPLRRKRHLEPIHMLVIRISGTNKIQSSKPCAKCVKTMSILPQTMGYKLKNIYYSNADGEIIKTNLHKLTTSEQHYSKMYLHKR